jgi:hypothetical protein
MWRIWAKALGRKDGVTDKEADAVAVVRSFIFVTYLITNCFIVANAIRHWNNTGTTIWICADKPRGGYYCSRR